MIDRSWRQSQIQSPLSPLTDDDRHCRHWRSTIALFNGDTLLEIANQADDATIVIVSTVKNFAVAALVLEPLKKSVSLSIGLYVRVVTMSIMKPIVTMLVMETIKPVVTMSVMVPMVAMATVVTVKTKATMTPIAIVATMAPLGLIGDHCL